MCKIQLTIAINFISSKDVDEECVMHSKSDNIEFMPYDNANKVLGELFESLLSIYRIGLETSIRGNDFIFDSIQHLYYKCYKINFKHGVSYIDSPDQTKKKTKTRKKQQIQKIKMINVFHMLLQLNHKEVESHPERVSDIKPFIRYNWD